MKQPKPILTFEAECKNCDGGRRNFGEGIKNSKLKKALEKGLCPDCMNSGKQTIKIFNLKDFERCDWTATYYHAKRCDCKGTGYKIPFESYEIKKVSEIPLDIMDKEEGWEAMIDHNLKESDSIVLVRE